jgi:hypothetical protein
MDRVESFKIQVSRVYGVAADLYLQCVLHVMLFCMLGIFCTFTLVLAEVGVQCLLWLFSVFPLFRAFPLCGTDIV